MERNLIIIFIVAIVSYLAGYLVRGYIDNAELTQTRGEMGLGKDDVPDECYGCKDVGLPCDPNCRYNKKQREMIIHVKHEENDSEED